MLSFSLVAEALTGLIYHRPSGENFKIPSFLCLMMGEVSPETSPKKHYDSRHGKLRNNMDTTESTNTNIFKSKKLSLHDQVHNIPKNKKFPQPQIHPLIHPLPTHTTNPCHTYTSKTYRSIIQWKPRSPKARYKIYLRSSNSRDEREQTQKQCCSEKTSVSSWLCLLCSQICLWFIFEIF